MKNRKFKKQNQTRVSIEVDERQKKVSISSQREGTFKAARSEARTTSWRVCSGSTHWAASARNTEASLTGPPAGPTTPQTANAHSGPAVLHWLGLCWFLVGISSPCMVGISSPCMVLSRGGCRGIKSRFFTFPETEAPGARGTNATLTPVTLDLQ